MPALGDAIGSLSLRAIIQKIIYLRNQGRYEVVCKSKFQYTDEINVPYSMTRDPTVDPRLFVQG